jgi:hypothetical protein
MLTDRDKLILAGVRRRHAARHARARAQSIVRKDRRPDTLAAGRAHRAMLKLYAQADEELRLYELHPTVAAPQTLSTLGASLRHAVDDVRSRAAKCAGSLAADAMRAQMREDATLAMRLVRRIYAALRDTPPASDPPQELPKLAPITPPPMPVVPAALHHDPDPTAQPEPAKSEYHWEKVVRRLDGSLAEWQAQRKDARDKYLQSDKGKAARKAATQRYIQSEKGKAARKRYAQSEKGKAAREKYLRSEKGKGARKRYAQSEKGKEARKRAQAAYRARKAASTTQSQ